jgi:hypothetical protein
VALRTVSIRTSTFSRVSQQKSSSPSVERFSFEKIRAKLNLQKLNSYSEILLFNGNLADEGYKSAQEYIEIKGKFLSKKL